MTYSIVARDEKTGQMGVAVQSHYFSVGSTVTWARAGVGAVATQSIVDKRYGPLGLELMSAGKSASESLEGLLRSDEGREMRQVAFVDSKGNVATHTGSKCIPYAGHVTGDGFSCQGNIMRSERVWESMRESYQKNGHLPLPERLVEALQAGEDAGGDIRGKQSAAILVVEKETSPTYWGGRVVELRVEDHPEPVVELRRLLRYFRGYECASRGDDLLGEEKFAEALASFEKAHELAPEIDELKYWVGVSLLSTPEKERGMSMLRELFAKDKNWVQVTRGILQTRIPPIDPEVAEELMR
ncbi:MAG TPA: DUF1028 domain-containing protein [Nitrososphaerales archaeon]|nr:DUF1028 domain-containing protein [Nitrososphaerales archaeon]